VPNVTCIIPVMGNTEGLETTLVSVLERRPDGCEVLVVLNAAYHDPYGLQGEIQILSAPKAAGLIHCVNIGIEAASSPVVHVLAAGYEVGPGWIEAALAHFDDRRVAAVAPAIYQQGNEKCLLAAGTACGTRGQKQNLTEFPSDHEIAARFVGPLVRAAFFRKSALKAFDGKLPRAVGDELADVDLALSLHAAGWKIVCEPESQIFAAAVTAPELVGFSAGLWFERLLRRHRDQISGSKKLGHHLGAELLGRLIGQFDWANYRQHRRCVAACREDALMAHAQWQANQPSQISQTQTDAKQLRVDSAHQSHQPSSDSRQRQTKHRARRR
jgi:cellulose synthase/poly-beta-1,6-N-acetylglucosamine synthase-like glycosyltransferase